MYKCMLYDKKGFRKRVMMDQLVPYYQIPIMAPAQSVAWTTVDTAYINDPVAATITRIEFRLVGKHKEYYIFREI